MRGRLAVPLVLAVASCAGDGRRFPVRDAMWRDTDLDSRAVPCREESGKRVCRPAEYVSSLAWDGAYNIAFRPMTRFFAIDNPGEAVNVNSMDEVPDSSWFDNRIGRRPMTPAEVAQGACGGETLDTDGADGSWLVEAGKPDGANPGFRVQLADGRRFMLKPDPAPDERGTAAAAIATRLYHAAGWYVTCERVIYVRRSLLRLKPGITSTDNFNETRPFDQAAFDGILRGAQRRGDRYRFSASAWLPGRLLGPFTYEGLKRDDPNDVVPHEDRRDLRGARLLAAWMNHFDSREQNSMTTWIADDPRDPDSSPGVVRHYYLDFNDCFGGPWQDEIWRRMGHAYYLDLGYLFEDFVTFGVIERPWDRARKYHGDTFGYYSARDFDPEAWRGGYPNPAFGRMTERDAAWAARIIGRFSDAHLAAVVAAGDFTSPDDAQFLVEQLAGRRDAILRRYFARLSPVTDVDARGREICAADMARRSRLWPEELFRYSARVVGGAALAVSALPDGRLCTEVPDVGEPGYRIVDVHNGQAPGALRVHVFDLGGERGLRIAGLERPEGSR